MNSRTSQASSIRLRLAAVALMVTAVVVVPAAAPVQAGSRSSRAAAAALPRAFPVTAAGSVRLVPDTIDPTGEREVSRALQSFIDRVPNGSTIQFPYKARYRLDTGLNLSGRRDLVLIGRQTRLLASGCRPGHSPFVIGDRAPSANIVVRGFRLVGSNRSAGTGRAFTAGCEYQMGIVIYRSSGIEIVNTHIRRARGDCVYIGGGGDPYTWSSDITFHRSTCVLNGRAGVAITAGRRVLVEDVTFDELSYLVLNIEPNHGRDGATDVTFRDNRVGFYDHSDRYTGYMFAANGSRDALVDRVSVTGNLVSSGGLRTLIDGSGGSGRNRRNITIADNRSTARVRGPIMYLYTIDGLTVQGNRQPLRDGQLAKIGDCTAVTFTD